MSEWISITKEQPAEKGEYLVICNGRVGVSDYWLDIGKWLSSDVRFAQGALVTHWMPLPEPPKTNKRD